MSTSGEKKFNLGVTRELYVMIPEAAARAEFPMPPKPRKSKRINKKQKERGFQ